MRNQKKSTNIITENLIVSDGSIAGDSSMITFNKITHIINLSTKKIENFFEAKDKSLQSPLKKLKFQNVSDGEDSEYMDLIGKIKYYSVHDWGEYSTNLSMDICEDLFLFIESAVKSNGICMIMSNKNTCSTVAVACSYLIMKYRWTLNSALEYISGVKSDATFKKPVLLQLNNIEAHVKNRSTIMNKNTKLRCYWTITREIFNPLDDDYLSSKTKEIFS